MEGFFENVQGPNISKETAKTQFTKNSQNIATYFAVPVTLLWEHFLKTLIGGCLKKQGVKKVHKIKRPFWPFPWLYYGSIF